MMRRLLLFHTIITSILIVSSSCGKKAEAPASRFYVVDLEWKREMILQHVSLRPSESCIEFYVWLGGMADSNSIINTAIHRAITSSYPNTKLSPAEEFAVQQITERSKELSDYYYDHYGDAGQTPQHLTTVYMRGVPTVMANKPLFGKEAGEDLSAFFRYDRGLSLFKCIGPDYKIVDTSQPQNFPLTEYFSTGTILPNNFWLRSVSIPQELSQDDDITLTFTFPVLVEHYWAWLLHLYENPDAVEEFTEMEMVLTASLHQL